MRGLFVCHSQAHLSVSSDQVLEEETFTWSKNTKFHCRLQVVALTLAGFLVGCRPEANPTSADFFPTTDSVPRWMKESATSTYDPENLWKYAGGDADKYLQAGIVKMVTSGYRFNLVTDAAVDVYVMGNAAGARKVYDSESASGSQPLNIGDAGRCRQDRSTFRQGRYFVRIVAYDNSPEIAPALTALAFAVSSKLSAVPADR